MNSREQIYTAAYDLARLSPGIKSSSRRLKHWNDVPPADQPALFMIQRNESTKVVTKMPTVWNLRVDFVLYGHNSGQDSVPPMSALNPIVDAIITRFLPAGGLEEQTLGGLVERCRIDGEIITDEGVLGDQAIVVIPVTILVPQ